MRLSILQLNINGLSYKDNLFDFLSSRPYDILQFQEVAGEDTRVGSMYSKEDNFLILQSFFQDTYAGFLSKTDEITPHGYFGNATFIKSSLSVVEQKVVWLHKRNEPFPSTSKDVEDLSRNILCLKIATPSPLWLLNTHLTWGPSEKDTSTKLNQSLPLVEFVASLQDPFILTGDFNVDSTSLIVRGLEHYGRNLSREYHLTNTLNPDTHRVHHLFPPGLAVDYIFTNFSTKVTRFKPIEDIDLSDHLGLEAEIEI